MAAVRSDRQRRFVFAMVDHPGVKPWKAADLAGFVTGEHGGDPEKREHALAVTANRLLQDQKILDAIYETAGRRLRSGALVAVDFLIETVSNEKARTADRLKAAESLLGRVGFPAETNVNVNHATVDITGAEMIERIVFLAKKHGLDPAKLLGGNAPTKVIEAHAVQDRDQ